MKKLIVLLLIAGQVFGQESKEWDVNSPEGNFKEVSITTTEGTWMNLDVSPDGKSIVFDMLGDIYLLPIEGGKAKLLRGGHAFEVQPRFSPDGKKISFTSDAGGGDNIWVMNVDGSDAKQITKEDFRLLNNATWTPDGEYLIARKHFTSTRSLGAGEIWMYHHTGGSGMQLTKKRNEQQDAGEPCVSPDGRYVYFSEDMYPGGYFQYNKDPNKQIYVIRRYDRENGDLEMFVSGSGGAVRPQVSPNGAYLAYVKRVREKTVLYVREIKTGREWPLYDNLSKDQQEAWAIFGVYTNFNWTPNSENIIIWANGHIWNIPVNTGNGAAQGKLVPEPSIIPFEATATHKIYDALRYEHNPAPNQFEAKVIRHAVTSPDGKKVVFNAIGSLYEVSSKGGKAKKISKEGELSFEPSFSSDGSKLLYVTWKDEEMGAIYLRDLKSGVDSKLTKQKGIYRTPRFSPDAKKIVYYKEGGNSDLGYQYCQKPGVYIMDLTSHENTFVTDKGNNPRFDHSGERIYFMGGGYLSNEFKSVDLQGNDEKTYFTSKYGNNFVPSPDGKWIAFNELFKVYVAPMPQTGQPLELTSGSRSVPVSQVAKDAGINLHWSSTGDKVHWTLGNEYFTAQLKDHFLFLEGAPDSTPPLDTVGVKIQLTVDSDKPLGKKVLKGATIITMEGDKVIENGIVEITDNKISFVGDQTSYSIPKDAEVIDVSGKYIMPGLVDVHAHVGHFRDGLTPEKHWQYYANLSYGVTTTHDPSANTEMVFALSELVRSGKMIGPRVFSTGTILYGADAEFKAVINSLEDARSAIKRTKAFGAFSVKSYNQPRRDQRQMVIKAARENKVMVVPEGGSFFFHNMSMILDGHTGIEHNIPVFPAYNDVVELWSNSETGYTPTLIVCYGAVNGEYYWYQHTNVWEKSRLLKFTPREIVDSRSRHRTMIPEEEYENGHILASKGCKDLSDAGVKVNLGAHGQLQGLGAHWELWMLYQGGMTEMEALRSATLNGAHYIGMDKYIGSVKTGKLADLIVLDANPLDDIYNTEKVKYTIVNGRVYDAKTITEVGKKHNDTKFWWEVDGSNFGVNFNAESGSYELPGRCSCGK